MRPLSEGEVLEVWERGRGRSAPEQALAALAVLDTDVGLEALAALPVGERDRRLLEVRRATLGSQLFGAASCPGCGLPVDFVVEVEEVLAAGRVEATPQPRLELAGFELELKPLDSRDLALAAEASDLASARRRLLELAVPRASHNGLPVSVEQLPPEVQAAVAERLEAHDPLAVVPLALACPRCNRRWQPLLDIGAFVWRELAARAERLMIDVDVLARGYGWSESVILMMSPARRQFYLELAPAARTRGGEGEEGGKA